MKHNLFIVIMLPFLLLLNGCASSSANTRDIACKFAKNEISLQLKSPSTAKFSACITEPSKQYLGRFIATGDVDAQNSFGAMIRSPYVCKVTTLGKTEFDTEGECYFESDEEYFDIILDMDFGGSNK